jgi:hypothetical protein
VEKILPPVPGTDDFAGSASDTFFRLNHELFRHFLLLQEKQKARPPKTPGRNPK